MKQKKSKKRNIIMIISTVILLLTGWLTPEEVWNYLLSQASQTTATSENKAADSDFYVTYLDVGQGDAALVYCEGHYMLIDGGERNYSDLIYTVLERNKINYLDIVVATHAHSDHIGGLPGALTYAKAGLVLCPVASYDSDIFRKFADYAKTSGPGITVPNKMDTYELGSAVVTILYLDPENDDVNDTSIVLRVTYADRSFLFTGDAERGAEEVLLEECPELLKSDILKVGHHGSDSSTTYPFLRKVLPDIAVISCGTGNKYGHPTDDTLSRLRDEEATVYRTDIHGDITMWYDEGEWFITTQKNINP